MLTVKTPQEVTRLLSEQFSRRLAQSVRMPLSGALSCVLAEDVTAIEYVPNFVRSTVDGYAVIASDTFGASETIPALLNGRGEAKMGEANTVTIQPGECMYVPTGGELPKGADAMVMLEYVQAYGDGTFAVERPSAPGNYIIFRGDDVKPGDLLLQRGVRIGAKEVGALAAMGVTEVPVYRPLRVGLISTGDELVPPEETPQGTQIRDVNSPMLQAAITEAGAEPVCFGILRDSKEGLLQAVSAAVEECDVLLLTGGSSVGTMDATAAVIAQLGECLLHGIAIKPGKPTIIGEVQGKPVFGLPGNPVAAYFVYRLFVRPLLAFGLDEAYQEAPVSARLSSAVSSNHGREECVIVRLSDGIAAPISAKSGLVTTLCRANGYIRVPQNCEGVAKGEHVSVWPL